MTVALVVITLLLTAPLASLASARVEARAGDTVAIAGDDDCAVETSDTGTDDTGTNGAEEDILEVEDENGNAQTQYEDAGNVDQTQNGDLASNRDQLLQVEGGDSDVQEAQYGDDEVEGGDNEVQQTQDGDDGDTVVARAGDTVAVASEDCDAETSVNTENVGTGGDADDIAIENDEEISDSTGQTDGDTVDTSDLSTLPPELQSILDESSTGEGTTQDGTTTQENQLGLSGDTASNEPAGQFRPEESGLGLEQLKALLLSDGDWSLPRKGELDRIRKPRRFDRKPGAAMTLSIRALNLYDVPVTNSSTGKAFDRGVIHVPDTADPWDKETQKNVFLAGHRLGDPGEEDSRLVFYHLDELKPKDEIVLKDRGGRSYKYRVKELFKVKPDDAWVADTLVGRDLLTLTTYSLPNLEDRIVVRADRVQQDPERQQNPDRLQQNSTRQPDNSARQPGSSPQQGSIRQPNFVRQQDSNRQKDSVRRQGAERKQDSGRPNPDRKKKRR